MEGWLEAFQARGLIHWDETMETYVRTAADLNDDRSLSGQR